jgi:hypothetical protein
MRWVGHVACLGEIRNSKKFWLGYLKRRYHLEDVGVDGRMILKLILGKYGLGVWIGLIWHRIRTSGGLL